MSTTLSPASVGAALGELGRGFETAVALTKTAIHTPFASSTEAKSALTAAARSYDPLVRPLREIGLLGTSSDLPTLMGIGPEQSAAYRAALDVNRSIAEILAGVAGARVELGVGSVTQQADGAWRAVPSDIDELRSHVARLSVGIDDAAAGYEQLVSALATT